MKVYKQVFQLGNKQVEIETGHVARQATASVTVRMGDSLVLVTAVAKKEAKEGQDFFPLTVNYQERAYAAGKIPGGFNKREGRATDHETLTARLIDRPLRPLFPKGFYNEIQIVASVLSFDPEVPTDILALIGASASLSLSGVPFDGPAGGVRVGFIDGDYVLNPSFEVLEHSELDLVVAGTKDAVLMVESEARGLPEDVMLGAVLFGHENVKTIVDAIEELVAHAGKDSWEWVPAKENKDLINQVSQVAKEKIASAFSIREKQKRNDVLSQIKQETIEHFVKEDVDGSPEASEIVEILEKLEREHVRSTILEGKPRIDGRDTRTVRPIEVKTGVLPRAHGSALFTRGETQALVVTTLGNDRDAQLIERFQGDYRNRYMLHYSFPPYCVGETGMMGAPKRREVGHGNLARRATYAVFPDEETYPYVVRVVSEITESNGSSSMATVCGSSLSMMDAGVPLAQPVAGIAMGLIKEGDRFAVLSDILGDEDHLGDMDFKVAGTKDGVTALQMDIKVAGITREIMAKALDQAKEGRLHILGIMNEQLSEPRKELSDYAPRIHILKTGAEKIKDIKGRAGSNIRKITEETGANIDLDDATGEVKIFTTNKPMLDKVLLMMASTAAEVEAGQIYQGKVQKLMDFGAFVSLLPGRDGLLHISKISEDRVENVSDVLQEGQTVNVEVVEVDRFGKVKLTMIDVDQ
ncbi:polyribonucleotide nucleotidyltransferase [Thiotrichales bacterium 19S9-12]|nr:polyribonucleotide nucleotidyltransferase [Thiotrichales bacterium 19S9-11]MCF6811840.1 polyribonucleotide nucleotidyltransferase [Thiotrichales bacterium 19S9-12]